MCDPIDALREIAIAENQRRIDRKLREQARRRAWWQRTHGKGVGKGGSQRGKGRPVITCLGERYANVRDAVKKLSKHHGITVTEDAIFHALQNPNRTSAKRRWAYEADGRPLQWKDAISVNPHHFKPGNKMNAAWREKDNARRASDRAKQ